jgi:lipopolysaccharide exporter
LSLTKKVASSASLILLVRLFQRGVGIISLLILARLLTPQDFGVVAIATMLVFLFDSLSEGGTQQYIIHKKSIDIEDLITAWTISIISKMVLFFVLIFVAPILADFVNAPEATSAIRMLSLVLPISAFASPQLFQLKRHLEYGLISKILFIERVFSFLITVVLAFYLQSYWAMIYGVLAAYFCKTILSHYYAPFPIKFSLSRVREQMSFSLWMLLRSLIGYVRAEFDIVFVSKLYGAEQLGGFSLMRNLSYLPSREIIAPISNVFLASFSDVKRRGEQIGDHVVMVLAILLFVISPITGYLFLYHEELVSIFLGKQWIQFSHLLPLLSFFTISFAVSSFVQQGLIVNGDIKLLSIYETAMICALIVLFVFFFTGSLEEFIIYRLSFALAALTLLLIFCFARFRLPIASLIFICFLLGVSCYLAVLVSTLQPNNGLADVFIGTVIYFSSYLVICGLLLTVFRKHRILSLVISLGRRFLLSWLRN